MLTNQNSAPLSLKQLQQICSACNLSRLCLPLGLAEKELKKLDDLVTKRLVIPKGGILFHSGDKFKQLIAVRSGAFKSWISNAEGVHDIISFHLPGELLGFDGIATNQHQVSVQAMETSSICEIPFNKLLTFIHEIPALQRQLMSMMGQKALPETAVRVNHTAEQRLASFLLSLSKRFKNCGYSANEFDLPMSREDIANYLGLAPETISRLLTHFQNDQILAIKRRHIILLDFHRLQTIQCAET